MTHATSVVLQLSRIEIAQLSTVVSEFVDLIETSSGTPDPAMDRLAPDAYPDDAEASREFERMTRGDLLSRRTDDAGVVLRTLGVSGAPTSPSELDDAEAGVLDIVTVEGDEIDAWLRTLTAVRLVLAARLGIAQDGDEPADDPRAFVYDWLGILLDGIVNAITP
jgi:hypothetical protein